MIIEEQIMSEELNRKYDQKTLGLLWGKSGGICAYPNCENELIIKTLDEIVGHICHIVGLKGPRADTNFSKDKLNKYENLVLMCRHHHGIIDIDLKTNTIEKLLSIKPTWCSIASSTYLHEKEKS